MQCFGYRILIQSGSGSSSRPRFFQKIFIIISKIIIYVSLRKPLQRTLKLPEKPQALHRALQTYILPIFEENFDLPGSGSETL